MLLLELRRFLRSSYFLVGLGIAAIFFFAGFCFQSATQQGSVSMLPWLLDTYTCFTQFGALVLSAYAISCISSDYSGKTTQFYKELGFSSWSYYLVRVGALWFPLMLGSVVLTGLVCLMYGDWSPFVAMVVHYSAVSLFYVSLWRSWVDRRAIYSRLFYGCFSVGMRYVFFFPLRRAVFRCLF